MDSKTFYEFHMRELKVDKDLDLGPGSGAMLAFTLKADGTYESDGKKNNEICNRGIEVKVSNLFKAHIQIRPKPTWLGMKEAEANPARKKAYWKSEAPKNPSGTCLVTNDHWDFYISQLPQEGPNSSQGEGGGEVLIRIIKKPNGEFSIAGSGGANGSGEIICTEFSDGVQIKAQKINLEIIIRIKLNRKILKSKRILSCQDLLYPVEDSKKLKKKSDLKKESEKKATLERNISIMQRVTQDLKENEDPNPDKHKIPRKIKLAPKNKTFSSIGVNTPNLEVLLPIMSLRLDQGELISDLECLENKNTEQMVEIPSDSIKDAADLKENENIFEKLSKREEKDEDSGIQSINSSVYDNAVVDFKDYISSLKNKKEQNCETTINSELLRDANDVIAELPENNSSGWETENINPETDSGINSDSSGFNAGNESANSFEYSLKSPESFTSLASKTSEYLQGQILNQNGSVKTVPAPGEMENLSEQPFSGNNDEFLSPKYCVDRSDLSEEMLVVDDLPQNTFVKESPQINDFQNHSNIANLESTQSQTIFSSCSYGVITSSTNGINGKRVSSRITTTTTTTNTRLTRTTSIQYRPFPTFVPGCCPYQYLSIMPNYLQDFFPYPYIYNSNSLPVNQNQCVAMPGDVQSQQYNHMNSLEPNAFKSYRPYDIYSQTLPESNPSYVAEVETTANPDSNITSNQTEEILDGNSNSNVIGNGNHFENGLNNEQPELKEISIITGDAENLVIGKKSFPVITIFDSDDETMNSSFIPDDENFGKKKKVDTVTEIINSVIADPRNQVDNIPSEPEALDMRIPKSATNQKRKRSFKQILPLPSHSPPCSSPDIRDFDSSKMSKKKKRETVAEIKRNKMAQSDEPKSSSTSTLPSSKLPTRSQGKGSNSSNDETPINMRASRRVKGKQPKIMMETQCQTTTEMYEIKTRGDQQKAVIILESSEVPQPTLFVCVETSPNENEKDIGHVSNANARNEEEGSIM